MMDNKKKSPPKRNQLIETGEILFTRHGIRRVTVEEICRQAGVSKMTFYKYFSGKLELLKEIWNGWSDSIYSRLRDLEADGASFIQCMQAIVEFKIELISKMSPELIEEIIQSEPEMREFIQDLRARSIARFLEFVSAAKERGEMRDIKPEFLLTVTDLLGDVARNAELRRLYPTDMEFIREINDFFFFGIIPAGEQR
jgi:AcrR family transcriptional regulator